MKKTILFILTITCLANANAQNKKLDTAQAAGVPIYVGKEFSENEMTRIKEQQRQHNSQFIGLEHKGFDLVTTTGEKVNKSSSKGKVSLFAFWDATCHYSLATLNALNEKYKDKPFQLVVVTYDTTGVAKMMAEEHLDLKLAKVRYVSDMQTLNYQNGYPSFLIMNKEDIVMALGSLHELKDSETLLKGLLEF